MYDTQNIAYQNLRDINIQLIMWENRQHARMFHALVKIGLLKENSNVFN